MIASIWSPLKLLVSMSAATNALTISMAARVNPPRIHRRFVASYVIAGPSVREDPSTPPQMDQAFVGAHAADLVPAAAQVPWQIRTLFAFELYRADIWQRDNCASVFTDGFVQLLPQVTLLLADGFRLQLIVPVAG